MSFADTERRAAASAMRLANASATFAGGSAVAAIFDDAYARADVGAIGLASTSPALTVATADVPANAEGEAVTVNGTAYVVVEHHPDGTGVSLLILGSQT